MRSTEGSTSDQLDDQPSLADTMEEGLRQIEANHRAAERLFVPSPVVERLLWQVCGAWGDSDRGGPVLSLCPR